MSPVTPCLWFDGTAEEAARFYVSLLPESRIDALVRPPTDWPGGKAGTVLSVEFTLAGQPYLALNGGPHYSLTPAVSFIIPCDTQAEIDRLWDALLSGGGTPLACGWIHDRYGLAWQVVPRTLMAMMRDPDPARVGRVMAAFGPMQKLDLAAITAAYENRAA